MSLPSGFPQTNKSVIDGAVPHEAKCKCMELANWVRPQITLPSILSLQEPSNGCLRGAAILLFVLCAPFFSLLTSSNWQLYAKCSVACAQLEWCCANSLLQNCCNRKMHHGLKNDPWVPWRGSWESGSLPLSGLGSLLQDCSACGEGCCLVMNNGMKREPCGRWVSFSSHCSGWLVWPRGRWEGERQGLKWEREE